MSDVAHESCASTDRRSGVLLHPTSLPGGWGIGDLGPEAYAFVDILHAARQRIWQVLPLGPPALGGSPYSAFSAIAGNPLLISLELLVQDGLLDAEVAPDSTSSTPLDFERVAAFKLPRLRESFAKFQANASLSEPFDEFCLEQCGWLDDYALFMALRDAQGGKVWNRWPKSLVQRCPDDLRQACGELAQEIAFHQFTQYIFFKQWSALRSYAHKHGIRIVGDIPFYVAQDSADVWGHPQNFSLDRDTGEALLVAGVPPDYFSQTGQLWNTPVYDWRHLEETGFAWWVERFQNLLQVVDVIRIDHFRGFAAYWQVPQGASTAEDGEWVEAPGAALFTTLRDQLGELPIWAEDLGLITDDVRALRDRFGFPGMKVLQFAFDDYGAANAHLPRNHVENCVCYTATHDNDTTRGWWEKLDPMWKRSAREHLGEVSDEDIHWAFIRLAMGSVANDVVIPWQDVLGLGTEARLNVPGTPTGNWNWRFDREIDAMMPARLAELTATHGRSPDRDMTTRPANENVANS